MLFAVSSCTYNQYTTTRGGYDDLYGGRYDDAAVVADNRSALPMDYNTNPDYQGGSDAAATDQYYDENYVTARNIQRNVSNQVGYNAGFTDGYFAGRNAGFHNNFYGGMFPSWGYPGFNVGFRMGMGSMIGLGYSPFGWNRWNRWGSFYDPYWDAMAWGDPFMYGGYGYPFYSGFGYPYGGLGFGMYGYNPYRWSNYYPIIVNNNYGDSGVRTRNYGPRPSGSAVSRTASSVSRREPGTAPVTRSGARTSTSRNNTASNDGYYTRPRSAVSGSAREAAGNSSSRVSGARGGTAASGNYYYANPNSDRSSYGGSSSARTRSSSSYRASESGRSSSSGYYNSAPSRSNNSYSAPSRSYSAPSSTPSRSYSTPSAPSRSYSAPSSAPSRSYSAPSSGGGRSSGSSGGGGGRGPR